MKKVLFIALALLLTVSCVEEEKKTTRKGKKKAQTEKTVSSDDTDRIVHNIDGVIQEKYELTNGAYIFLIKLENGKYIEWETTRVKYKLKDVTDKVHFDFLAKERFSDKAL